MGFQAKEGLQINRGELAPRDSGLVGKVSGDFFSARPAMPMLHSRQYSLSQVPEDQGAFTANFEQAALYSRMGYRPQHTSIIIISCSSNELRAIVQRQLTQWAGSNKPYLSHRRDHGLPQLDHGSLAPF